MTDSHLCSWKILKAVPSGKGCVCIPTSSPIPVCDSRDTILQRGCGFRLLESSIPGALPRGCNASLQRLLSLCLEFVNDLVSIIPGIELLISRVVMNHGVTS